jgi:hypothetical protein
MKLRLVLKSKSWASIIVKRRTLYLAHPRDARASDNLELFIQKVSRRLWWGKKIGLKTFKVTVDGLTVNDTFDGIDCCSVAFAGQP